MNERSVRPSPSIRPIRRTFYVPENMMTLPRRKLFRLLGIDWLSTPYAWVSPIWLTAVGIALAAWLAPVRGLGATVAAGLGYTLLILLSIFWHGLGHLLFGRWSGHPMQAMLLTSTLPVNVYDERRHASRVHLIRAAGGPVFSLLLGAATLALSQGNHYLSFVGVLNLIMTVVALQPIPTMDGGVFLRELRDWRKG